MEKICINISRKSTQTIDLKSASMLSIRLSVPFRTILLFSSSLLSLLLCVQRFCHSFIFFGWSHFGVIFVVSFFSSFFFFLQLVCICVYGHFDFHIPINFILCCLHFTQKTAYRKWDKSTRIRHNCEILFRWTGESTSTDGRNVNGQSNKPPHTQRYAVSQ